MLLQLAVGVIVAYGGIVGVMYLAQRSLMYVPDLARVSPAAAGLPQAEEVTLTTADSERLVAWHVAPQSDRPVILYLQGNGGALRNRVRRFARLVQDGFGVVAISYRMATGMLRFDVPVVMAPQGITGNSHDAGR